MNIAAPAIQKAKVGTCPHGLPLGACPICNGMGGGGGGGSIKKKPEMSWSECYVAWQQMLKSKNNPNQIKNETLQTQMISQYKMQLSISNTAAKLANLAERLTTFAQKPQINASLGDKILNFGAKLVLPVVDGLKNIATALDKGINIIKEKMANISDKLNAMFGELKASVEKKISDKLKDFKKKIKTLFGITDTEKTEELDDEEKELEESKRLFELKTTLNKIKEKFTPKE